MGSGPSKGVERGEPIVATIVVEDTNTCISRYRHATVAGQPSIVGGVLNQECPRIKVSARTAKRPEHQSQRAVFRRARVAVPILAVSLIVSACTPVISVPAGQDAAEPVCADVVLSLPDVVLDQERSKTTSQATAAWGEAGAAVTFICGVAQPDPASEDCQSITLDIYNEQETFDWIMSNSESGFTFVSYGREPAMMVQVPSSLNATQPTAALLDVANAVAKIPATKACR